MVADRIHNGHVAAVVDILDTAGLAVVQVVAADSVVVLVALELVAKITKCKRFHFK